MKKPIFVAICLLISSYTFGQIYFKPYAGINSPSLSKDIGSFDSKGKVGYQFGADLLFGGSFFFQVGANFESSKLSLKNAGDLKISRLNIPAYVGFNLTSNDNQTFGLRLFAGPNVALNINKKLDDSLNSISKDDFNDLQFSLAGGVGLDLSILFVDVGYRLGLSKAYEDGDGSTKKNIFFANAGLRIPF